MHGDRNTTYYEFQARGSHDEVAFLKRHPGCRVGNRLGGSQAADVNTEKPNSHIGLRKVVAQTPVLVTGG